MENETLSLEAFFQPEPHEKLPLDTAFFLQRVKDELSLDALPATVAEAINHMRNEDVMRSDRQNIAIACLHHAGVDCDDPRFPDKDRLYMRKDKDMKHDTVALLQRVFAFPEEAASAAPAAPAPKPAAAGAPAIPPAAAVDSLDITDDNWVVIVNKAHPRTDIRIDTRKDFPIYRGLAVTAKDDIYLEWPEGLAAADYPAPGAPLVLYFEDDEGHTHIAARGHLAGTSHRPRIVIAHDAIHEREFEGRGNFDVAVLCAGSYESAAAGRFGDVSFFATTYHDVCLYDTEKSDRTLCIDFGTSNTTAGSYGILDKAGSEPELVTFPDVTSIGADGLPENRPMVPTIVYVKACDPRTREVRYAFGYDAKAAIIAADFTPKASVFPEIKSWEGELDEKEDLHDESEEGHKLAGVPRREIVKAYIEFVIQTAEQHFHCRFTSLHFSAPVKLKDSFLHELAEMFSASRYEVCPPEESIDEGIAIVYDHIYRARQRFRSEPEGAKSKERTILIFDCGGGTTDLAQCAYTIENHHGCQELEITTQSEGGNSNFGGNNITYRILQLLKIKIADRLRSEAAPRTMQDLIADSEESIMQKLDDASLAPDGSDLPMGERGKRIDEKKCEIYRPFQDAYDQAEAQVPTRFALESGRDKSSYLKRNFYYLWQMAEDVKIQFFRAANIVDFDFSSIDDRAELKIDDGSYYLYVRQGGAFRTLPHPMEHVSVTIKEINRLICADLYALMLDLFTDDLLESDYFKLSGQSCKISLFRDLMKEFIPGRFFRRIPTDTKDDAAERERKRDDLKMACVRGCIHYFRDTRMGEVDPHLDPRPPKLFYRVCRRHPEEDVLWGDADGRPQTRLLFFGASKAREAVFCVVDPQGQISMDDYCYTFVMGHTGKEATFLDARELADALAGETYPKKAWGDADEPLRDILKDLERSDVTHVERGQARQALLLLPAKSGYGFLIVQIEKAVDSAGVTTFSVKNEEFHKFRQEDRAIFFDGRH